MSVSPKGFVTRELHIEALKDLDKFLVFNSIERPVLLFMDGASPHISLEALHFCKENEIQPWLFRPNMTHILQVYKNYSYLKKTLMKRFFFSLLTCHSSAHSKQN